MNYEQMPSRGKSTSTGVAASEHGECRGRCYVHYDENRFYRVECEHCGDVFKFTADSLDQAIERWNIIVAAGADRSGLKEQAIRPAYHLEDCNLGVRLHNCLGRAGYRTLYDLIPFDEEKLLQVRNLKAIHVHELKTIMINLGLIDASEE